MARGGGAFDVRIAIRDKMWLNLDHLRVFGPFVGLDLPGVRGYLQRLREIDPTHPLVCRLDETYSHWQPMSDTDFTSALHQCVVSADDDEGVDEITRRVIEGSLGHQPAFIVIGGGYIGFRLSHVMGDGRVLNLIIPDLIDASVTGRDPRPLSRHHMRLPLGRIALRHFGRHPQRIFSAVRLRRLPPMTLAPGDPGRPWKPSLSYYSVRAPEASIRLRQWRDVHAPGVSFAAMICAVAWNAFAEQGISSRHPGIMVLADMRRFLPPGVNVRGNVSWGQYLVPDDPTDPCSVHRALQAELSSGRGIVMMALRHGRMALSRRRGMLGAFDTTAVVPTAPVVDLALTHLGHLDSYASLPWDGPCERWSNISVPPPSGPVGVTLSTSELQGSLYVNVGFHASTFDRETIVSIVDQMCSHPTEFLA